ncbi:Uncharacterised protein [Escherichia coli]|nr:Uncharacterised protein [Escherichia coli]
MLFLWLMALYPASLHCLTATGEGWHKLPVFRYPTITIRGQLSDNMVYTEKHIRIISVTTAAAIHPVIGSSENDVQLRTRHPETTAD